MRYRKFILIWCLCVLIKSPSEGKAHGLPYAAVDSLTGTLDSVGSDSLNNLMTLWAEAFQDIYPNVTVQIEGKGSSTAPTALIEGTAQLGPMSRAMKSTEVDAFRARFGYDPHAITVALDTLALYVHRDNPLETLSMKELDAIYSSTFFRGANPISQWSALSLPAPWSVRKITLYGRNSASGTYGLFKNLVLRGGDFRQTVNEQPGSSAVVQAVGADLFGIGYSGIGYRSSGVKVLAISQGDQLPALPTLENCLNGQYPITRLLYIYVNKHPENGMDPVTREFIRFVLSVEGQKMVAQNGYYQLPHSVSNEQSNAISGN
jgi:phosphate transport system substrate-binding protein